MPDPNPGAHGGYLIPNHPGCLAVVVHLLFKGRGCGGTHSQLPAGEVPGGPSEPRWEELPRLLPAGGGRGGRAPSLPGPGEGLPAVQLPGTGEGGSLFLHILTAAWWAPVLLLVVSGARAALSREIRWTNQKESTRHVVPLICSKRSTDPNVVTGWNFPKEVNTLYWSELSSVEKGVKGRGYRISLAITYTWVMYGRCFVPEVERDGVDHWEPWVDQIAKVNKTLKNRLLSGMTAIAFF